MKYVPFISCSITPFSYEEAKLAERKTRESFNHAFLLTCLELMINLFRYATFTVSVITSVRFHVLFLSFRIMFYLAFSNAILSYDFFNVTCKFNTNSSISPSVVLICPLIQNIFQWSICS